MVETFCVFVSPRSFLPKNGRRPVVIISIFWSKSGVASEMEVEVEMEGALAFVSFPYE
jgi:hypothetical protein